MLEAKLELRDISKTFIGGKQGSVSALQAVSLYAHEGEIVSLIGPSGCGKSTLLDMVAGLTLPDSGVIILKGASLLGIPGRVSYMPQKDVLFPWRSILDNVIIPLEIRGVSKDKARNQARELLEVFGLKNFGESYPWELSGGMKQRAAFLRTYLSNGELMLLDEPFGKLDALTKIQLQQWLMGVCEQFRPTVLFVTHDVEEAILLSDRVYVFSARPGRVVAEVEITLTRPRQPSLTTTSTFAELKAKLLGYLANSYGGEVNNE